MTSAAGAPLIRRANLSDLDAVVALENEAFSSDRISRRGFRRFIGSGSTRLLVAELSSGVIGGYVLLQLPRHSHRARIYSVAVSAASRGMGVGTHLLLSAEETARHSHRTVMTLEVRVAATRTRELYDRLGYSGSLVLPGYYEDGGDGLRLQKDLETPLPNAPARGRVPLLVVDERTKTDDLSTVARVVTVREYLAVGHAVPGRVVINLSASYEHMTRGYYVSLLADARAERCYPGAYNLLDINWKRIHRRALTELEPPLQRAADGKVVPESVLFFFGHAHSDTDQVSWMSDIALAFFDRFRCPILRIYLGSEGGRPIIEEIEALAVQRLSGTERRAFIAQLAAFLKARAPLPAPLPRAATSIAMLVDPAEKVPPSDEAALQMFEQAALDLGARITRVDRHDLHRLTQFDALFIRETTRLDHHTYRFARKAEEERLPVYDSPDAILKCTNKIFLFEMLRAHGIPTPKTIVFDRKDLKALAHSVTLPAVLKVPDSAFSMGVYRVDSPDELVARANPLFDASDLLLLQSFVPTAFDWRIGVLDGSPLFACRYFMADGHWQIMQHDQSDGEVTYGEWETLPLDKVPAPILDAAVQAARPIGRGIFGVDVKETSTGPLVIEVNDNPNLDVGVEDAILGPVLYRKILSSLLSAIGR